MNCPKRSLRIWVRMGIVYQWIGNEIAARANEICLMEVTIQMKSLGMEGKIVTVDTSYIQLVRRNQWFWTL